jgi:hypothetical protein
MQNRTRTGDNNHKVAMFARQYAVFHVPSEPHTQLINLLDEVSNTHTHVPQSAERMRQ